MSKNPRQKQKLLYLQKILLEKTDEDHGLSLKEIIDELKKYDITAERKSIYDDIETLISFGLDVNKEKSKTTKYFVCQRDFQTSELKLLVDSIQSSKFITEKKSKELIEKLEKLTSENQAKQLQRQVYVSTPTKSEIETIYYNVDAIHNAISNNKQIHFIYNKYTLTQGKSNKITLRRKRNGAEYIVSPWMLCWDNDNYYLVAYEESSDKIKHYRVDKMSNIYLGEESRQGEDKLEKRSKNYHSSYRTSMFGMFGSDQVEQVKISAHEDMIGVFADRFGRKIFITKDEENPDWFITTVDVCLSDQFYGWLFALGTNVKILAPEKAVNDYKKLIESVKNLY